ncbi:hypothetical protein WQ57_01925 [Mesobacillus campisalis]|uniref:DUF455 domain-containing protein n=1 Tax=Mesobacillus campisalis TaxID=1408103 RepID=A0A0M2SZQ0_9BACI|nr:DUF455 family protein [Mesobacillus campisalis]KKK40044.1 hypothetical protein WQ57_01925 [Mesobacillus campisalis]
MTVEYLPSNQKRGKFMRYDTAVILKRYFLCERALVIGQAGWLSGIPYFDVKMILPKMLWEDAMTAHELRNRVYELRFPSRMLEIGDDQALVDLIQQSYNAPNPLAFVMGLSRVFKPALKQAFEDYLEMADVLGDGPTHRFLELAVREKEDQIQTLEKYVQHYLEKEDARSIETAMQWVEELREKLGEIGGIGIENCKGMEVRLSDQVFTPNEVPNRDDRFIPVRFYWPDIVDKSFPYGEGVKLQLRSAISHLNEIWAVENAGFILHEFAGELGWDFIYDAARWVYDESRHCTMGYERLKQWGFEESELPLGTYIFDSCKGKDPIYRLGMLFYFESKNIGKKPERIKSFAEFNDQVSQHDMDFDWADETIHTAYGKRWLSAILEKRGLNPKDYQKIKDECDRLVDDVLKSVTEEEVQQITQITENMVEKAKQLVTAERV